MKKYALPLLLLFAVSSCIKVENEEVSCANKPGTPSLTSSTFVKNLGDTLLVSLSGVQTGVVYSWRNPSGELSTEYPYSLMLNSTTLSGAYTVEASSSAALCKSDKATFNVTVNDAFPSCGLSTNTFELGGANTLSTGYGSGNDYTDYYSAHWSIGFTDFYVRFGKQPAISGTQVFSVYNTSYPDYLDDDQCSVLYYNGSSYNGTRGSVFVRYDNGTYHIAFCNVNMMKGSVNYPNSQANVYCSE